jgi:hypothetical protein
MVEDLNIEGYYVGDSLPIFAIYFL